MLGFNLISRLKFLKPVYFFQTSLFVCLFVFFQTSSLIEVGCKDGAVVRTLASHQCGLEVPLNG